LQGQQFVEARIFFWRHPLKLVFSDIDGTVTKSDVMGHVMTILKKDWTHDSIAILFNKFVAKGCKIIYITARPFSQVRHLKKKKKKSIRKAYF
jgi:phosphatidate phosphatase LPIN